MAAFGSVHCCIARGGVDVSEMLKWSAQAQDEARRQPSQLLSEWEFEGEVDWRSTNQSILAIKDGLEHGWAGSR
jgi:hypothetical protein